MNNISEERQHGSKYNKIAYRVLLYVTKGVLHKIKYILNFYIQ